MVQDTCFDTRDEKRFAESDLDPDVSSPECKTSLDTAQQQLGDYFCSFVTRHIKKRDTERTCEPRRRPKVDYSSIRSN
jgi:hypothetical protein